MNGLNGSVAVLTTSTVVSTIAAPDATNLGNKTNNNDNSMEVSTNQIIRELSNEDHYAEHEEYSTGKSHRCFMCINIDLIELIEPIVSSWLYQCKREFDHIHSDQRQGRDKKYQVKQIPKQETRSKYSRNHGQLNDGVNKIDFNVFPMHIFMKRFALHFHAKMPHHFA